MENLSVLTGKYGDEGDQLIFKILNSGDYLDKISTSDIEEGYKKLLPKISKKALRYDLTVPFARFVVMNRNDITFPFKRYQIQPVWRSDRPQKGRYCEFYQCDADVIGTPSLLCEAEIIMMIHTVFKKLNFNDFLIKVNNRKILAGIAEVLGKKGSENDLCVAIDKLDKIGIEAVKKELLEKGFDVQALQLLEPFFQLEGSIENTLSSLKKLLISSATGLLGISELEQTLSILKLSEAHCPNIALDVTLARGLSYYTGAIFEVKATSVQMGSICGGGRYDNLTGVFGLPNMSGVGISFGIDRIYDVLDELNLFPVQPSNSSQLLCCAFDEASFNEALSMVTKCRAHGINSELYPETAKMKKQLSYADDKKIPYVVIIGENERLTKKYTLKNMQSGEQNSCSMDELLSILSAK
jgi:histidyl-tRNA synthetase